MTPLRFAIIALDDLRWKGSVLRGLLQSFWGASDEGTVRKVTIAVYLCVVVGLTVFFLALPAGSQALQISLNDPDNYQRLVEVRDWLGGQSWWDTRQYRINPPQGLQMHWSRLADVPLAIFILFFGLFTDSATAEVLAVASLPPLMLLVTLVFLGRAARNVAGVPAERFVQLFAVATPVVLAQFIPGRIDHHGLQLLLLAGVLAATTARPTCRNGLLLSLATSLSLLVGLENVPLHLAIIGWVAVEWLVRGESRVARLRGVLAGLLFWLPLLYALSVNPREWGRLTHDEIGIGHIVVIGSAAATLVTATQFGLHSVRSRILSAVLAAVAAVFALALFPGILAAPYAAIDPNLAALWIEEIAETESALEIASDEPSRLLYFHLFPTLALIAGAAAFSTTKRPENMLPALLVGLIGFLLCLWQFRAMGAASLVALLLCAIVLAQMMARRERPFGTALFFAGLVGLNGLFGPMLYHWLTHVEGKELSAMNAERSSSQCEHFLRGDEFNEVPAGLVLNGIDSGAIILARTHHSVLAAGNHRAIAGNADAYRILMAPASRAREEMAEREIDYLLTCRDSELHRLSEHAPDSFAADLYNSRFPDWLEPIPHDGGDLVLFFAIPHGLTINETPRSGLPSK